MLQKSFHDLVQPQNRKARFPGLPTRRQGAVAAKTTVCDWRCRQSVDPGIAPSPWRCNSTTRFLMFITGT